MKLALLLFVPVLALAQPDSISLPMKGRIVSYETTVLTQRGEAKDITKISAKWLNETFEEVKEPRPRVNVSHEGVQGTGIMKITINDAGDYYWMKFSIDIRATDSTCVFQVFDFYEKSMFKGVTNDYSKIEYRWRDFRKGKPWSPGDARLFAGLDAGVRGLMKSYAEVVASRK